MVVVVVDVMEVVGEMFNVVINVDNLTIFSFHF